MAGQPRPRSHRAGRPRRTCTRVIPRERWEYGRYGLLPWWATVKMVPWSSRAVLSLVMARLCAYMEAIQRDGEVCDEEDLVE